MKLNLIHLNNCLVIIVPAQIYDTLLVKINHFRASLPMWILTPNSKIRVHKVIVYKTGISGVSNLAQQSNAATTTSVSTGSFPATTAAPAPTPNSGVSPEG